MNTEKYPLHWPFGYKKTDPKKRIGSKFKQTPMNAQEFLHAEISRLGGKNLIVSSNIPVRQDGFMYSDAAGQKLLDPGVAIYFKWKDRDVAMCCDQYLSVWENVYALGKGIEALRGMDRWGVSNFLDRAFTGFMAIEEKRDRNWNEVLGVAEDASIDQIKSAYKSLAKQYHPDVNPISPEKFVEINNAYVEAMELKTNNI